ncbi:MAG: DUF89 domain-containing protein [Clostridiaceae bacterium]
MFTYVDCIPCVINKANIIADKYCIDKADKMRFMKKVMKEIIDCDENRASTILDAKIMRITEREYGIKDVYKEEKKFFNDRLLEMEEEIEKILDKSENRLFDALKIALSGNIIDFSALHDLELDFVKEIINKTINSEFNENLFNKFKKDLQKGGNLLYLGDNAGEIVFDKIFIKEIKKEYKDINIVFATRGKPVINDVTLEDAKYVGMDNICQIIDNGTDIPGTDLVETSESFNNYFKSSNIIIAKGQGNYETLCDNKENIYFLFLCKCDMMVKNLGRDKFSNVFINQLKGEL